MADARSPGRLARRSAVVELQAGAAGRPVLHLLHDEDGSLAPFAPLVAALGPEQPVCGIEPPLATDGRVPFSSAERLALRYVADLQRRQARSPFHLLGVGAGGVLAFEVARLLRIEGESVALMGVVDCGPGRLPGSPGRRTLPAGPDQVIRRWKGRVETLGSLRPGLDRDERRRRRTRAALRALTGPSWRPRPFDGDLRLFWSQGVASRGPTLGWSPYVRSVTVVDLAVDHRLVLDEAHVHHLAEPLREQLGSNG